MWYDFVYARSFNVIPDTPLLGPYVRLSIDKTDYVALLSDVICCAVALLSAPTVFDCVIWLIWPRPSVIWSKLAACSAAPYESDWRALAT
jgi:hypothetical protein